MTTIEKIKLEVSIDHQFIEDVLVTALEGGSNFWIDSIKINHPGGAKPKNIPTSIWAAQALINGGTIQVYPSGTKEETCSLNTYMEKAMLVNGIKMWAGTNPIDMEIIKTDGIFTIGADNIDADDADTIMQYALFGKLVFG